MDKCHSNEDRNAEFLLLELLLDTQEAFTHLFFENQNCAESIPLMRDAYTAFCICEEF